MAYRKALPKKLRSETVKLWQQGLADGNLVGDRAARVKAALVAIDHLQLKGFTFDHAFNCALYAAHNAGSPEAVFDVAMAQHEFASANAGFPSVGKVKVAS